MARGQKQAADTQLNKTNSIADANQGRAAGIESTLIPGYTSLMDTGYLSPEEEAAATTSEMGSATAPFQTAKFEANNNAATTRNAADLTANEDQLALEEGRTAGDAAARLQEEKMQNQEAGMYGLGQEEAGNRREATDLYGLGPSTLNSRAAGGGWSQGFHDVASSLNFSGGGKSGGCWIAAAVYDGWDDPRTIDVRRWLNTEFKRHLVGRIVMRVYVAIGEPVAWLVKRSALLKRMFKPLFDKALEKARG